MQITKLGLLSTLLEAIGLLFVFFDMRMPKQMKRIEKFVDMLGDEFHAFSHKHHTAWWYQISLSIMIGSIMIIGVGSLVSASTFSIGWWILFWASVIMGSSIIIVALLGDFISLLNKVSVYDQAVTTLGFLMAVSGLFIEIGQLFGIF